MRQLPIPGTASLSHAARRTGAVRGTLAGALVLLVLLLSAAVRHPAIAPPSSLPARSGDVIVLDLSASISSDTFSLVGETLRKLVTSGGRYGLVVFSNTAYEALPPGSPASALRPLIPYFTVPASGPGTASALPTNPWSLSFSNGTRISTGLDLAHRIVGSHRLRRAHVVLISDLADDPADLQHLNEVATTEYGHGRTPLSVVALNATPADQALFAQVAGASVTQASPPSEKPASLPDVLPGRLPFGAIVAIVAAILALAAYCLWAARLRWDEAQETS